MRNPCVPSFVLAITLAVSLPCAAEGLAISASSAGSSASSAGSASLRGSSDSIGASSDSSRTRQAAVRDGEYRVAAVGPSPRDPGLLRLALEPVVAAADAEPFRLDLPVRALGAAPIEVGDHVLATQRDYGIEFARARTRLPFFLVLDDAWNADLQTRALTR